MRLLKDNICPFLGNLFPFSTIPLSMCFNIRVLHDICVWSEGTLVADVLIVLRQPPHSLRFPSRQILFMGAEKYTFPEEGNTKVWPTCPACWSPVLVSHGSPTSASICHLLLSQEKHHHHPWRDHSPFKLLQENPEWMKYGGRKSRSWIREGVNWKKTFSFGHCPNDGGGVYPCPNFLALFLEVHFWSIKRVYFFKNANVLNF